MYGHRAKLRDSEQRSTGRVVHIEVSAGVVTVIAAWMLDPVACASMELGEPRVTVAALRDLHQLLIERGLRRKSPNDSNIVREKRNEYSVKDSSCNTVHAAPDDHDVRRSGAVRDERGTAHAGPRTSNQPANAGRQQRCKGV